MNADATAAPGRAETRRAPRAAQSLLILFGLAVYLGVVWYFGWQEIRILLLGADLPFVFGAALCFATGTWMRVYKWRFALGRDHPAIGLFFMSKASAGLSPARLGEFAPLLWRRHRSARVGGWLLLDRLLEIAVTLLLGILGLTLIALVPAWVNAFLWIGFAAGCALIAYALTRHRWFAHTAQRWPNRPRIAAFLGVLARTSEEIRRFTRALPAVIVITLAAKVVDLYAVVLIFRALGVDISIALASAAKCALVLVSFLPLTPVPTGVPHAAQGWLMNLAADVSPEATVASVGIEVILLAVLFWTFIGLAARAVKDAAF